MTKAKRDKLIKKHILAGWTYQEVSNLIGGISRQRIGQLAKDLLWKYELKAAYKARLQRMKEKRPKIYDPCPVCEHEFERVQCGEYVQKYCSKRCHRIGMSDTNKQTDFDTRKAHTLRKRGFKWKEVCAMLGLDETITNISMVCARVGKWEKWNKPAKDWVLS